MAINKVDLASQWSVEDEALKELTHRGWAVMQTSAKMGLGVERMFLTLGQKMMGTSDE